MNEMYNLTGLLLGVIFGAIMQRAHILRFDNQLKLLLFKDFRVLKFLLTASVSGAIFETIMYQLWYTEYIDRTLWIYSILLGGVIFGIGWAILGYCPGTALGALGEGRYDALFGVLGGLTGTFVYDQFIHEHLIDPLFLSCQLEHDNLALGIFHVNPWFILGPLALISAGLFWWLERRKL
jgi:uncharacterized protein